MTDERTVTTTNGYNLSAGRSDELADFAPWPDGDDYTWDDDDDGDAWASEDAWVLMEQKLQQAERTIANLRGEMQVQRDGALLLAFVFSTFFAILGVAGGLIVGALIW